MYAILLICLCYYSCVENEQTFDDVLEKQDIAQLSTARQWFAENYGIAVQTRAPGDSEGTQTTMILDWDNAKTYKKGELSTVETPIIKGWSVLFADERTTEKLFDGEKIDSLHNLTRLVVETNRKEETTRSFIMTFVGSYDYLTSGKSLRKNTYLKRMPDFDGTVLFYTVEGDFMNGWKYENGEITEKIIQKKENSVDSTAKTRSTLYTYDCYWVWTEHYYGSGEFFTVEVTDGHEECYLTGVFHWEDSENNGGIPGGAGSGRPSDNKDTDDDKKKKDEKTPCAKADRIAADERLNSEINKFMEECQRDQSTENGWIKTGSGETIKPSARRAASLGYNYNPEEIRKQKIVQQYHTHPGGTPRPSWTDLQSLAREYISGYIDPDNFSYGIISDMGCTVLVITSEKDFRTFAEAINADKGMMFDDFNDFWSRETSLDGILNYFMEYLSKYSSGLDLIFRKGDTNTITQLTGKWNAIQAAIDKDGKRTTANQDCK
jgi:hypothetical protein